MSKVTTLDKVMDKVHDGAVIGLGGFLGIGVPLGVIDKLLEKGVKDLTLIGIVNAHPFAGGNFGVAKLFKNKQIKKFICSHAGTCPEAVEQYRADELEIEYYPMGTWIEKLRAAGSGLGGVLTPTGVGTLMEEGKQKLTLNGKEYILELPLSAEIAFIKGYRADKMGNIQYRRASLNSNPVLAMAADYVVAEVDEIVEAGEIEPELVGTPSIFVDAIVQCMSFDEHQKAVTDLWTNCGQLKVVNQ